MRTIEVTAGDVDGKHRFKIHFAYDHQIISLVKGIPGARWSHFERFWHIAYTQANMNRLTRLFGNLELFDLRFLEPASDVPGRVRGKNYLFEPLDQKDLDVLSKQEVKQLLTITRNLKHRAMLSLVYACGLRRGELLNLMPTDIDSDRGLLIVKNAKGRKDRVVSISDKTIELLREYYKQYRPKQWLFEGISAGNKYDERSLQHVLKKAVYLAKIKNL